MKIFKFSEFVLNEAVTVKQVIEDVVDFLKKSPVITLYPEDKGDLRQGWISKEHKMYSVVGIKKHFADKYSSLNIDNAVRYTPSIKILTKALADKGMTLQTTPIVAQFGEKSSFFSVNLSDSEINTVKEKYEKEFADRYGKYTTAKREAPKKAAEMAAAKEVAKKAAVKKAPAKKAAPKKAAAPKAPKKEVAKKEPVVKKTPAKKAAKKNEAFELLIEKLFTK